MLSVGACGGHRTASTQRSCTVGSALPPAAGGTNWKTPRVFDGRALSPAREAALIAASAASLAALLLWLGPPGNDLPAHLYQRQLFIEHGFVLWNNFWYAGRYSFVTYSLLYYPLAAMVGIKALAVASVATAALAFSVLVVRQWGPVVRISGWAFAIVWPGTVLSATFPFALGAALALLALCALQAGRRRLFAVLAALSLAASPLAFALLGVVVIGAGVVRRRDQLRFGLPLAVVLSGVLVELSLYRLFPGEGHYPFRLADLLPALAFAALGLAATLRVERARPLAGVLAVYGIACASVFVIPADVGGNMARLRYLAVPLALLAVALRGWKPLRLVVPLIALACIWNLGALAGNFERSTADKTSKREQWAPAIAYLRAHLSPDYRVEAVDTVGHWPAVYLPEAGIPLVRGWYRQDDFPENEMLYDAYGPRAYRAWLQRLAVKYVVVANGPPDYSARAEANLLSSGRSGMPIAFWSPDVTIYSVPRAQPVVTGPAPATIMRLLPTRLLVHVGGAGTYRVAVRYSPYWRTSEGCLSTAEDGMLDLTVARAGLVDLDFKVNVHRGLGVLTGSTPKRLCEG